MATIWPLSLMPRAPVSTTPELEGISELRSCMPVALVHTNARPPSEVVEVPTTTPALLMLEASLNGPPSVPRSWMLALFQRTACVPVGPDDEPTTSPTSLTCNALLAVSPAKVPRACIPVLLVHKNARVPA